MTWAPSFGPARPATYTAANPSPPPHRPYSPPVSLVKKVQGDIVYSDDCRRDIPVPKFHTQPCTGTCTDTTEKESNGLAHA